MGDEESVGALADALAGTLSLVPVLPLSIAHLPPDVLAHVAELAVATGQSRWALRLTCSAFARAVLENTTSLAWIGSYAEARAVTSLPLALLRKCPSVTKLDLRGLKRSPDSLDGCPSTIHILHCGGTASDQANRLRDNAFRPLDLSPLVACSQLEVLDIGHSRVTDLSPLAHCTMLRVLTIDSTQVASLQPLVACKQLKRLNMVHTLVADLSPLAACPALEYLDMQQNKHILSVSPLAACMMLKRLSCSMHLIQEVEKIQAEKIHSFAYYHIYWHPGLPGVNILVDDD
jgi:Leucine-rich repeat (LRR) protein